MAKVTIALIAFVAGVVLGGTVVYLRADSLQSRPEALRAWLRDNPEFLADNRDLVAAAEQVARSREAQNDVRWRQKLVADRWLTYLDPAFAPSIGPRSASRVLVEFTDYACEPCRSSAPAVKRALGSHSDIRLVLFLLPTSGDLSEYAARVAFAGYRQNPDRFAMLHESLLNVSGPLTSEAILGAAARAGLDTEQIEVDLRSPEVRQYIARATQFAQDLHVAGVPHFLLDGRILAGGVSEAQLGSFLGTASGTALRNSVTPPLAAR